MIIFAERSFVMVLLEECIDKLKKFKESYASRYGISRIGVFGSVARREQNENSDVDIVVEMENPTLSSMFDLREHLCNLFSCQVDVVRYRQSLRPNLKISIEREAIYV